MMKNLSHEELVVKAWFARPELGPFEEVLLANVVVEIFGERFRGWSHGTSSTYNEGCRGPLCTQANRSTSRARNAKIRKEAGLPPVKTRVSYANQAWDSALLILQFQYNNWKENNTPAVEAG